MQWFSTKKNTPELSSASSANPIPVTGQPLVRLRELMKSYRQGAGETTVLRGIDLEIRTGEFVGIVGKSGSGKTTLLNMITGIDRPTSGEIWVGNTAVHRLNEGQMAVWRGQNLGIVFQFFQLLPMITLLDNILLPMDFCNKIAPRLRKERALHLLELVGMADHADQLPSTVSGGQQQRVAIARALANDPPLIIADEPTGNLDSKTAEAIFVLFEKLASEGKTFLIVTHDTSLSARMPRTACIVDGEMVSDNEPSAVQHVQQAAIPGGYVQ